MKKIISVLILAFTLVGFNQAKSQNNYYAPVNVGAQGGAIIKDYYLYTTSTQSGESSANQPIMSTSSPTSTNSIYEGIYIQASSQVTDYLALYENTSLMHVLRCNVLSTSYMNIVNNYTTSSITVQVRLNINGGASQYGPSVTIPPSGTARVGIPTGAYTANGPLWISGTTTWPGGSFIALYVLSN